MVVCASVPGPPLAKGTRVSWSWLPVCVWWCCVGCVCGVRHRGRRVECGDDDGLFEHERPPSQASCLALPPTFLLLQARPQNLLLDNIRQICSIKSSRGCGIPSHGMAAAARATQHFKPPNPLFLFLFHYLFISLFIISHHYFNNTD